MSKTLREFNVFIEWAKGKGYDTAHTFDTERSRWVVLNPMTADLWECWRAALADQAQAEPDRRLQLAMQNAERWKAHALELSARLQQYEPGAGMALNAATQPAAQPVAAPDERKAFESWARIRGFRAERTMPADAAYNDSGSQIMWESWQARAMLAAAPKVQP